MTERDAFEVRFGAAIRGYAGRASSELDPVELAHRIATSEPRRHGFAAGLTWRGIPIQRSTWILLLLAALLTALVGGMLVGGSQSPSNPLGIMASPTPSAAATPTPPAVTVTRNVAYESADTLPAPGVLDVYSPARTGSWPLVVMFHGFQDDKSSLSLYARRVADRGFVVFVPSWGATTPTGEGSLLAANAQAACAVAFAQRQAPRYGGDAAMTIVYGWSAGAHVAATVAFARPEPTRGCLGGATLESINALITWAGSWVLSVNTPDWDAILAADPKVMDAATPWTHLAEQPDLKVVILVAEEPLAGLERAVGDPWAADSWLAVRDPSGDLRRRLEANGAFADGTLEWVEVQQLLFSALRAQGNPVSLDVLPDSTDDFLAGGGWDAFLAAFDSAAAGSS